MAVYFVYKLKIKGTGYFYIGVTTDLEIRKNRHMSSINYFIASFRFNRKASMNAKGYKKVAAAIIKGKRFLSMPEKLSLDKCVMQVLDIKDTPEQAGIVEDFYLQKYKNHQKCFNILHKSTYSAKIICQSPK